MPSTPRGQRTRKLIIERTSAVFDQRGFAGATLNDLVNATGLTRGAFYFHFDSKDALAEAIVQAQQERWLPAVERLQREEPDPLRRLIRLTFHSGTLFQGDLVMRAGSRLMTERALIRRELWRSYPWWLGTVRDLLSAGSGDFSDLSRLSTETWPPRDSMPAGIEPGVGALAEHLVGMWSGVLQQSTAAGRDDLPERVRTSWLATLPWLCRDENRCSDLLALVEELTAEMRQAHLPTDTATDPAAPTSG
jgi:AcrR family transcriptional regulator